MGALATAWQVRVPAKVQLDLTNPDVEQAVSVNATVLAAAETDATNTFLDQTGVAFDSTNTAHITVAVLGVTYFLHSYKGLPRSAPANDAREAWDKACARFARTRGALVWNSPITDSNLQPTRDQSGALPKFDRRVWQDVIPRAPNTGAEDDSTLDFGRP